MLSTDQTHLRRYLTTLGVTVAAGTLSLAGLFLKLQEDMLVTRSTLAQVTPTARATLLERQRYLAFGTSILPYFVLLGFLGGLSLAAYGMIGWGRRQKVTDALEDLALRRGQVELRQMTAEEQAEELNREAEESAADIATPSAPQVVQTLDGGRDFVSDIRNRAMILEASLMDKLQAALGPDDVQSSLRASGPIERERVTVDALARLGNRNIVFELKYVVSVERVFTRIRDAVTQLDRGVRAVIASGTPNVSGVAIVVLPDAADDNDVKRSAAYGNEIRSSLKLVHQVLVIRYSDFLSLSPGDLVRRLPEGQ